MLEVKNLYVGFEGKVILKGVNLKVETGSVHALMGPNGSGKTTLSYVLMGHPKYKVMAGQILLNGEDITRLSPDERAKRGLFLSFQMPVEIPGVTISNFLRQAYNTLKDRKLSLLEFRALLEEKCKELGMDAKFLNRYLNQGFSGGEKKKAEILQMLVLNPKVAVLDETDSGLDVDALKLVAKGISKFMTPEKTVLVITHYKRILEHLEPEKVSVMVDGKIAFEGDKNLVQDLEQKGYSWIDKK
ncbi:Fe-S cluster assembly ATPase SufC [Candidatus Pacearchaeota archaeon]|nr:Fe-S cluster assembly ATPase SufC [Candidatus Pacearchaeota archaeon]